MSRHVTAVLNIDLRDDGSLAWYTFTPSLRPGRSPPCPSRSTMSTSPLPPAVFAMDPVHLPELFPPPLMARLRELVTIDPALVVRDFTDPAAAVALAGAEVLITGWGCPHIDADVLDAAPRLRTVLHAAGSVRSLIGDAVWAAWAHRLQCRVRQRAAGRRVHPRRDPVRREGRLRAQGALPARAHLPRPRRVRGRRQPRPAGRCDRGLARGPPGAGTAAAVRPLGRPVRPVRGRRPRRRRSVPSRCPSTNCCAPATSSACTRPTSRRPTACSAANGSR